MGRSAKYTIRPTRREKHIQSLLKIAENPESAPLSKPIQLLPTKSKRAILRSKNPKDFIISSDRPDYVDLLSNRKLFSKDMRSKLIKKK
ncbi:hypothetical protein HMI54_013570 [Coelomomyces lativittatus]|nr:hypothetical protein HMI56_005669 [Coelomomyces lativittatus]KAJ1497508.1 hypothetical protein HMI54_013570 [Coelomomyces lativittatus]KAJ1513635.1 hypothetical protein HMI55_005364 [Coelomomyces lativittatus]